MSWSPLNMMIRNMSFAATPSVLCNSFEYFNLNGCNNLWILGVLRWLRETLYSSNISNHPIWLIGPNNWCWLSFLKSCSILQDWITWWVLASLLEPLVMYLSWGSAYIDSDLVLILLSWGLINVVAGPKLLYFRKKD